MFIIWIACSKIRSLNWLAQENWNQMRKKAHFRCSLKIHLRMYIYLESGSLINQTHIIVINKNFIFNVETWLNSELISTNHYLLLLLKMTENDSWHDFTNIKDVNLVIVSINRRLNKKAVFSCLTFEPWQGEQKNTL